MSSMEVGYEIEANERIIAKLREQRAARQELMREAAARKESESLSYWFTKISQKMQVWVGIKNGLY